MSSLIPKISIGRDGKRNSFDLSCMTHTTSEIGYVQPTFGRTIIPDSKIRISTRTGSRLSPLYVPTMGKIDIRHYHCFVPYSTLWTPFDSFITKQNYTLLDGTTYQPNKCPWFKVGNIIRKLTSFSVSFESGYDPHVDITAFLIGDNGPLNASQIEALNSGQYSDDVVKNCELGILPKYVISSDGFVFETVYGTELVADKWFFFPLYQGGKDMSKALQLKSEKAFPSNTNFDFSDITYYEDSNNVEHPLTICYNFNGALKRLRTIFMGLGYSFNPYDDQKVTPFKALAFFKAYYALFGVNREKNFYNTYCYKLVKALSETTDLDLDDAVNSIIVAALWINFVRLELSNCTYTCPVDYFSAADTVTARGASSQTSISSELRAGNGFSFNMGATTLADATVTTTGGGVENPSQGNPLAQQIASRLLRFVNKNSVIGRKISDILRVRYGVSDLHNQTHESIIRVGASSTDIEIAAIYNNTDTEDLPLGAYAGAGMSSKSSANSKSFTFETSEFGCLLTLTAVVPKMGYWQGMLRENSDGVNDYTEFYQPEFDALGWQSVRYNELVADKQTKNHFEDNPVVGTDLGIWGYLPRMSHLKTSFNRCLGDISIPHMQDSMLPYTLDRFFKNKKPSDSVDKAFEVEYSTPLPVNEAQSFRSGTQGDTNRIFTDMSPTDDHVIMQIFFDVKMSAPMKSIATSFDTWDENSSSSVEVAHE